MSFATPYSGNNYRGEDIYSLLTLTGQLRLQTALKLTDGLLTLLLVATLGLALSLHRGEAGRDVLVLAPGEHVLLQAPLQGGVLVVLSLATPYQGQADGS